MERQKERNYGIEKGKAEGEKLRYGERRKITASRREKDYGIEKSKKEIAKKLLKKSVPIEEIEEITGLDEETIKNIE